MLTIDNTLDGYLKDVEIKGNTIQDINGTGDLSDIRSVGTKVEGQELYEIDIVSRGKNLFDVNDVVLGKYVSGGGVVGNKITIENRNACGYVFIRVKPNTTYIYKSSNIKAYLRCMDTLEIESGLIHSYSTNTTIQTLPTTNYLAINVRSEDTATNPLIFEMLVNSNIQLEEGTQATPYEPYQGDKLTILSPTPLEKVGDIADRIICKDGVWGVEKNIVTETFDDSYAYERMVLNAVSPTEYTSYSTPINGLPSINSRVMSDKFLPSTGESVNVSELGNLVSIHSNGRVYFRLKISELTTDTGAGFKEWLRNNNNIMVKYQATRPTFIPLPHSQQVKLRTFANKTNISFLTEIEGTIKASVPKSLGATVNTHTSQIDNLNKELDRVKKLEESTVTTVTSNKAFTTVAETNQGYFEDVKVEGKTLVNLADIQNKFIEQTNKYYIDHTLCSTSRLKLNTPYTFIIDCKYLEGHNSNYYYFEFGGGNIVNVFNSTIATNLNSNIAIMRNSGVYVLCVEFKDFRGYEYLACRPCRRGSSPVEGEIANYDISVLLLEGDHTDKDLSYFEGLKSVGQDSDEIEISSVNENLFDVFAPITRGFVNTTTGNIVIDGDGVTTGNATTDYIYIGGLNKLNIGFEEPISFRYGFYDINKKFIKGELVSTNSNMPFVELDVANIYYMRISIGYYGSNTNNFKGLMVTVDKPKYYNCIPRRQDKKEILYYNSTTQTWEKPVLREWDSIEKHSDGKYYYHKRSGEVVLNGSENWGTFGFEEKLQTVRFYSIYNSICRGEVVCDKIPYNAIINESATVDGFAISGHTQQIRVSIEKSKLSTQDVAGFKAWLQANNVTVVYQLAQEEVYECTNLDLITYQNETNLIVNSGAIQPKATLKVLSNVSNVVKLLQEKVSVLESDINKYMISQNRSQLDATYKSDSVTFKVDYVNSSKNMTNDYSEDLYNLILDNILVGKDNYNYNHMFNLIMDYASWNKITWEQFDILLELIELQNNPVEELPEELN